MSSPYLTIVTKKLGALSDDMRLYFDRVINNVETLKAFQHRENLAYIILSQAIDAAPKELTKTVPEQAYTTHLARYLHEHEDHHARLMHSSQFPGVQEYLTEFTSDDAWGDEGYLTDRGLIPMPTEEREAYKAAAMGLTNLSM